MQTEPDPLFLTFQQAVAGRYSIDRELGRGGMGVVYLAREVDLDRLVAIKLLPPERAARRDLRDRFLREARLAAKLSHPNIIPIHAVEEIDSFVFYVMAFVDGETLADRVRTRGPLPATEGARVLREVAWALAYAHEQGLVHRDVKPDNILLESATSRVLVADFGIAAAATDTTDGVSGTPEFMSPEQALGAQLDARSDIYGWGATAFYAYSGRFPFEGTTATEILAKQVTEPPPHLASLGLSVPRKVATLIDRCLAKAPDDRPVNAHAVAEQLGASLERRRELPMALRSFVKRSARLDGGGTVLAAFASLGASVGISALTDKGPGILSLGIFAAALPFTYFVSAAKRLARMGFRHEDLEPAFKAEIELGREERAVEKRVRHPGAERWLLATATTTAVPGAAFVLTALNPPAMNAIVRALDVLIGPATDAVIVLWAMCAPVALITLIGALVLKGQHEDLETRFWYRVWHSAIGRSAFRLARKLLGNKAPETAMTHRATELSLGLAAEQLYEQLPRPAREQLGDVPAVLKRLQTDAAELRRRHDELQEALSDAPNGATSAEYADVRMLRDDLHAKLGEAVGALETIRLNLLRLHAGQASVEGVTTHLGIAAEVSEDVERLIAAHGEVERALRFPRTPESTPA